jgi:hypothetical protein
MATNQTGKPQKGSENQALAQLNDQVGKHVLHTLGQPDNLFSVQVRRLWDDHYRVNVLVGPDTASARIANSYFLVADSDGNIITSTPQLTRKY